MLNKDGSNFLLEECSIISRDQLILRRNFGWQSRPDYQAEEKNSQNQPDHEVAHAVVLLKLGRSD